MPLSDQILEDILAPVGTSCSVVKVPGNTKLALVEVIGIVTGFL